MVAAHVDVGEQVDQLTQHGLVELWARIVLGQNVLQDLDVGLFDGLHRVVDQATDIALLLAPSGDFDEGNFRPLGIGLKVRPAGLRRHPKHIGCEVLFRIFRVGIILGFQTSMLRLEGLGGPTVPVGHEGLGWQWVGGGLAPALGCVLAGRYEYVEADLLGQPSRGGERALGHDAGGGLDVRVGRLRVFLRV